MNRNYFVYQHVTPDGMYYFGVTKNIKNRWRQICYNGTSLETYIEKYGWNRIQHNILLKELTYKEAKKTEDMLISIGWEDGVCINKMRSGLLDKKEYDREYQKISRFNDREKYNEYHRDYYNRNKEKLKEKHREYMREYRARKRKKLSA